jgi:transcriptional regulator with XRE-family HTH domain
MKVAEMIMRALEQKGNQNLRASAKKLGVSPELLRLTVKQGHIPKDSILEKIADKLGIDRSALLLAAHKEKFPLEVKGYFLSPSKQIKYEKRRVWPLSEEQCSYLEKILSEPEIQLIRKFRQIPDEEKAQIIGHLDYSWAMKKITMKKP